MASLKSSREESDLLDRSTKKVKMDSTMVETEKEKTPLTACEEIHQEKAANSSPTYKDMVIASDGDYDDPEEIVRTVMEELYPGPSFL
ncbi:hypothetical protein SESBI_42337 [Sesbania bispinosa]|nr:hypothetical protein SESBI_42337 [Sesbania bispinosa]